MKPAKLTGGLITLSLLTVGLAAVAPTGQAQNPSEDLYPPIIPVGPVYSLDRQVEYTSEGESDSVCAGRFVLRASCEVHVTDANSLVISNWAQPIPTGDGTDVSSFIEIRIYDLDNNGAHVHTCQNARTDDGSNPVWTLNDALYFGVGYVGASSCDGPGDWTYTYGNEGERTEVNLRIEIESDSAGWVWIYPSMRY